MGTTAIATPKRRDRRAYNKLYNKLHRERLRESSRAYAQAHREQINARQRELYHLRYREKKLAYYQKNRERLLSQKQDYYQRNRGKIVAWRIKNKKRLSASNSQWHRRNREKVRERKRAEQRKRMSQPFARFISNMRRRINKALSGSGNLKSAPTEKLLGCTFEEFRRHIEKQFDSRMHWGNHSVKGWHIDHIIPCAAFDFSNTAMQRQCFHFTNLRPLWGKKNLRKSAKVIDGQLRLLL